MVQHNSLKKKTRKRNFLLLYTKTTCLKRYSANHGKNTIVYEQDIALNTRIHNNVNMHDASSFFINLNSMSRCQELCD